MRPVLYMKLSFHYITSLYAVITLYDEVVNWFSLKSLNGEGV